MEDLFTERFKFKDIIAEMEKSEQKGTKKECKNLKALTENISKEYNIEEDNIEYIRKKNPLRAEDIKIEDGERAAIRYINTADVDRDNEIVMPDGAQVKDFQKSMTVLYAHDYRDLPIGRDLWIKLIAGKGWLAKTLYAEHQKAADIYNLVKDHFLNTSSIGFIPLESVTPDSKGWDKIKEKLISVYGIKEKLIDTCRRIYTKWILLEHSDVPIPSNINALNIAVGKGYIKSKDLLKDLQEGINIIEDEEELKLIEDKSKIEDDSIDIDEEGEVIKFEEVEKPLPNEHGCRLIDPKKFRPDSFRRMKRESDGKEYSIIIGKLKGETKTTEQAYRYNKDIWTVTQAKKHCKDHKGILFEPAGPSRESEDTEGKEVKGELLEAKERDINVTINIMGLKEMVDVVGENQKLKKRVEELEDVMGVIKIDEIDKSEDDKATYKCECIKCNHKMTSKKHCDTLKCPKCGGKMRRAERPGPGKESEEVKFDFKIEKTEDKEIELNPDEIKDIIVQAIKENVRDVKEGMNKRIDDNFKKAIGKVV